MTLRRLWGRVTSIGRPLLTQRRKRYRPPKGVWVYSVPMVLSRKKACFNQKTLSTFNFI